MTSYERLQKIIERIKEYNTFLNDDDLVFLDIICNKVRKYETDIISTHDASKMLGLGEKKVRNLIENGSLRGRKLHRYKTVTTRRAIIEFAESITTNQ